MLIDSETRSLPKGCTFSESDWRALARPWYPVGIAREVTQKPLAVRLLDEKLVLRRISDGSASMARELCLHRDEPLSLGWIARDKLVCNPLSVRRALRPDSHQSQVLTINCFPVAVADYVLRPGPNERCPERFTAPKLRWVAARPMRAEAETPQALRARRPHGSHVPTHTHRAARRRDQPPPLSAHRRRAVGLATG
jgi:hypothetical protein